MNLTIVTSFLVKLSTYEFRLNWLKKSQYLKWFVLDFRPRGWQQLSSDCQLLPKEILYVLSKIAFVITYFITSISLWRLKAVNNKSNKNNKIHFVIVSLIFAFLYYFWQNKYWYFCFWHVPTTSCHTQYDTINFTFHLLSRRLQDRILPVSGLLCTIAKVSKEYFGLCIAANMINDLI